MQNFYLALCLMVLSGTAWANEQSIANHCRDEWPSNREMYSYYVAEQRKAVRSLVDCSGPIRNYCDSQWSTNYEMVLHWIKEQEASKSVTDLAPQDEIAARCAREWPNELDMQEHCANERRTAKDNIERNYSGNYAVHASGSGVQSMKWLSIVLKKMESKLRVKL